MAFRLARPSHLVDLRNLKGLDRIAIDESGVVLGARTRWRDIEDDARLAAAHPLLQEAIRHVAHYQVRNRGTVGGSLAHADPASEMPCIAVTCEAELRVLGPSGERRIRAAEFFLGPAHDRARRRRDHSRRAASAVARRPPLGVQRVRAQAGRLRARGCRALLRSRCRGPRDATSTSAWSAPATFRSACRERSARSKESPSTTRPLLAAARIASEEADPTGDFHASAEYRKALVGTLLERALSKSGNVCHGVASSRRSSQ